MYINTLIAPARVRETMRCYKDMHKRETILNGHRNSMDGHSFPRSDRSETTRLLGHYYILLVGLSRRGHLPDCEIITRVNAHGQRTQCDADLSMPPR